MLGFFLIEIETELKERIDEDTLTNFNSAPEET